MAMDLGESVVIIGSLDTGGEDVGFVKDLLRAPGREPMLIDFRHGEGGVTRLIETEAARNMATADLARTGAELMLHLI